MVTLTIIDGFEHGQITVVYDGTEGSPSIVTTPVRTGSRALELTLSAAAEWVSYGVATTYLADSLYIRFASLPTAEVTLATFINANGNLIFQFDNVTGRFMIRIGTAAGVVGGPVVAVNTWYRVDREANTSTGTASLKCKIDGGTEFSTTRAQALANITLSQLGTGSAHTYTAYYDDWVFSTTAADYPVGAHSVVRLLPSGDGTHNTGLGAYQDQTGVTGPITDLTTTSWQLINDAPLDIAISDDFIRQSGNDTASYVEHTYENLPAGSDVPIDVRGYAVDRDFSGVGTSLCVSRFRYDGGATTTDMRLSTDDPGTEITARKKILVRPAGGWTRTLVDGITSRLGFGDGDPDSDFFSLMLEGALQPSAVSIVGAAVSQQRSSSNLTGQKQAEGITSVVQHTVTAVPSQKIGISNVIAMQRDVVVVAGEKQVDGATIIAQHVVDTVTGEKIGIDHTFVDQRVSAESIGQQVSPNSAVIQQRTLSITDGVKTGISGNLVIGHTVALASGQKLSSSGAVLHVRAISTSQGLRSVGGIAVLEQRSVSTSIRSPSLTELRFRISGREPAHRISGHEPVRAVSGHEPTHAIAGRESNAKLSGHEEGS